MRIIAPELRQNCARIAHLRQQLAVLGELALLLVVGGLHQHHRHADERALAHDVDRVREHRREEVDRLAQPRPRARDPHRHRRAVPHVRVVAFGQQLHHLRRLRRRPRQHEADRGDGGAAHVVGHVGDGDVEEAAERGVRAGARVREGDGVDGAVPVVEGKQWGEEREREPGAAPAVRVT